MKIEYFKENLKKIFEIIDHMVIYQIEYFKKSDLHFYHNALSQANEVRDKITNEISLINHNFSNKDAKHFANVFYTSINLIMTIQIRIDAYLDNKLTQLDDLSFEDMLCSGCVECQLEPVIKTSCVECDLEKSTKINKKH